MLFYGVVIGYWHQSAARSAVWHIIVFTIRKNIMKNRRLRKYLEQKALRKPGATAVADKQKNPPKHVNQDFNGFPNAPATEDIINPETATEKKTAAMNVKDGEKMNPDEAKQKSKKAGQIPAEQESEGSGGAFDATEQVKE
jgi:hypothetical protein